MADNTPWVYRLLDDTWKKGVTGLDGVDHPHQCGFGPTNLHTLLYSNVPSAANVMVSIGRHLFFGAANKARTFLIYKGALTDNTPWP